MLRESILLLCRGRLLLLLLLMVMMLDGNCGRCRAEWQGVGQFGQVIGGICATIWQNLLPLPLGPPVLVPSLHLRIAKPQPLGQISAILNGEILLAIKLAL